MSFGLDQYLHTVPILRYVFWIKGRVLKSNSILITPFGKNIINIQYQYLINLHEEDDGKKNPKTLLQVGINFFFLLFFSPVKIKTHPNFDGETV